ncbi:maleylpyruvate isomerase family mycothiol-dependent enzyme [Paeniglutamicibacter sp. MACA_103]|uniref:maleylpyruvate isomerase family mycothiol-dependent enzyme n=1 Tax=Paeniglutamicibacter sp. MACA_103 TaxID=3377337 RepID=UPI003895299A
MNDMDLAQAERTDLADFLGTLDAGQWEAPSLCEGWRVRDVVAHVISYDSLDTLGLVRRFAKGRLVKANQVGVDEMRGLSTAELLETFRAHTRPRGLAAGIGGRIGLVDGMIHHQDIRRSLGLPREIPAQRLHRVLETTPGNPRLAPWRWIRGLRLAATDLDWSHGKGPLVSGTGEALLMAMAGRPVVVSELSGEGAPALAARLTGRSAR